MTDAAWLSSARVVRCWVKSRNERNPCYQLPASKVGHSGRTAGDKPEEGGDDVKSSWLLRVGLHTCYNGDYRGERNREVEQILKSRGSACRGEYVPGSCTHRPSRHGSLFCLTALR